MGQSYEDQQLKMRIEGIERVRIPKWCKRCNSHNSLMSKKHNLEVCFHCSLAEKANIKRVVVAVMASVMLMLAGCATPPAKMNVDVQFAGQTLKVQVMR